MGSVPGVHASCFCSWLRRSGAGDDQEAIDSLTPVDVYLEKKRVTLLPPYMKLRDDTGSICRLRGSCTQLTNSLVARLMMHRTAVRLWLVAKTTKTASDEHSDGESEGEDEAGNDEDLQSIEGRFLRAAQRGRVPEAQALLASLADSDTAARNALIAARDEDGYSAIHRAAYNGRLAMLRFLLARCASVLPV